MIARKIKVGKNTRSDVKKPGPTKQPSRINEFFKSKV